MVLYEVFFKLRDIINLEIISFISSCLALLGALQARNNHTSTYVSKIIKASIPCFMATSLWIIHHAVLVRISGLSTNNLNIPYSLLSYTFLVFGFYISIKIIDIGFYFSNYISGAIIGIFICIHHMSDKYFLMRQGIFHPHSLEINTNSILLILSFVILWSSISGYLTDYYKNHEQMSYLEKMAYTDNLTKLSNRNAMNDYFKNILSEGIAKDHQFACIIIDLNNFKEINDNYGHLIGDEILSLIGTKLKASCENTRHFLGRLGGDEFIVLARYQNLYEIEEIANKIYSAIVEVNYIGNNVLRVGCCMGISLFPENGATQEILMKQADESLYKIKEKHMSGICFYSNSFV